MTNLLHRQRSRVASCASVYLSCIFTLYIFLLVHNSCFVLHIIFLPLYAPIADGPSGMDQSAFYHTFYDYCQFLYTLLLPPPLLKGFFLIICFYCQFLYILTPHFTTLVYQFSSFPPPPLIRFLFLFFTNNHFNMSQLFYSFCNIINLLVFNSLFFILYIYSNLCPWSISLYVCI